MDPIHQFQIKELFPVAQIGPFNIAFTNSALFMVLSVVGVTLFLLGATRGRALVPGRVQMTAELFYNFMADSLRNATGPEGMAFFPLVFLTVIIVGFWKNGLHFLRMFVPSGVPGYMLPLVVPIEVMSFLTRPVSHSIRLFANMLAGHITLQVFAGFVTMLGAIGLLGVLGAVLPLAMMVALTALELLVAVLQAYVFAILTCIYLNDALHPGH